MRKPGEMYSADQFTLAATNLQVGRILVTNQLLDRRLHQSDYDDRRVIGAGDRLSTTSPRPLRMCVARVRESAVHLCVVLGASSTGETDGSTYFGSFVSASRP